MVRATTNHGQSAISSFPRPTILISVATAFSLLGDQFLYAVLPSYFDEIGLLPIHVGILLSANRWVRFITNPIADRAYRRIPMRSAAAASFLVGAALTAVYASSSSFAVLLVARLLWGLCWSFIRQAGIVTVVESTLTNRVGRAMGFYNGVSRSGALFGMVVGAFCHDVIGYGPTLIAFAALSLAAVPIGYASRPKVDDRAGEAAPQTNGESQAGLLATAYIMALVGAGMIVSTTGHLLQSRAGDEITMLGATVGVATVTGAVLGIRWAIILVGAPALGALSDRFGRRSTATFYFLTGGAVLLVVATTSDVLPLVLGVVVFLICVTGIQVLLYAEAGLRGSRAIVAFVTGADLGGASGPLLAWGVVQAGLPHVSILLIGGALYLVGAVVARWTLRGGQHQETQAAPG